MRELLVALTLCVVASRADAQRSPSLPPEMIGTHFAEGTAPTRLSGAPADVVLSVQVGYANKTESALTIRGETSPIDLATYEAQTREIRYSSYRQTHVLDYKPTSTAAHDDPSHRLFVAGWIEATSQAVVEEWTFDPLGVQVDEAGVMEFTPPTFTVRTVLTSKPDTLGPAWSIASYPEADALLYLEHSASGGAVLHEVDVPTGATKVLREAKEVGHLRAVWSYSDVDRGRVIRLSRRLPFASHRSFAAPLETWLDETRNGVIDVWIDEAAGRAHRAKGAR